MKRILPTVLAILLTLSLISCTNDMTPAAPKQTTDANTTSAETPGTTNPPSDTADTSGSPDTSDIPDDRVLLDYVTTEGMYEVSDRKNVIVFMLDRFDHRYADHLIFGKQDHYVKGDYNPTYEPDQEVIDGLSGFTFYENFTGSYARTYPSVAYLLTGVTSDYSVPYMKSLENAWSATTFLSDIKQAGYDARVYSELDFFGGDTEFLRERIDNIYQSDSDEPYVLNDLEFRKGLLKNGITVDPDSKGTFLFYHMLGSHNPFLMNAEGEAATFSDYAEGRYQQTRGNFKTIFEYIEMLKDKGVYDKTTIIITADHGFTGNYETISDERVLSLFIKPAGADTDQPLQFSMKQLCQDNLRASISSYFGLPCRDGHRTIEDIGEKEELTRIFRWNSYGNGCRDNALVIYEIKGDANKFSNWSIVRREAIDYPYYDPKS